MEKNNEPIFSATFKHFFLFIMVMLMMMMKVMVHGISHGYPMDQADQLVAFWDYSNPSQGLEVDDHTLNMVSNSLSGGGDLYYDQAGKMEDDIIQGGLPGPGCSSLGVGAMVEIGPFGVNPDGKTLYTREHAWTQVANVLFLDSPAGVGFSYYNTMTDYNFSGDKRTAQDSYTFLLNWFRRYPQYNDRDYYIAGESCAGFYIPELADTIINGNKEANPTTMIQLKGTYRDCLSSNNPKCNETRGRIDNEIGEIDLFNVYSPGNIPNSVEVLIHVKALMYTLI
ncbi:hypothetical protein Vadar_015980 [Vaccinium darrowii]|uniref:Uncharacterized protein n=1 Tax=Vaccinium darrowii TaxID=229202 RepID=A0ACB7YXZ6_9ERIC|nr:hypothetical protein Vadar_015980 [Vaccinium darrowii]